jgi:hypothetical protein
MRWRWSAAVFILLARIGVSSSSLAQSPYAAQLISQNGVYGGSPIYNDPNAVLGEPTRIAVNNDVQAGTSPYHVSLVEPAQNRDQSGNNILTTLARTPNGSGGFTYGSITVKFDHPVVDDPTNPYGIDLNVFGNAYYVGNGFANDSTDMRAYNLVGSTFAEPVVISVSSDNINWYTYNSGPYGDTAFPTQSYTWSGSQHDATGNGWVAASDYTKPVNPALRTFLGTSSIAAADAMSTYLGSGGGTGIDLAASGFASIQYVRVESTSQFRDGEIDAFADVRPAVVGEALSVTPDNVAATTAIYFKNAQNPAQTAVVAQFTSVSDLAKLSTSTVTDSAALAALPSGSLLATYELDVQSLLGSSEIGFATNYQLSPGPSYAGNGSSLELLHWNGSAWQAVAHTFDALTGRITVANWSDPTATFAVLDTAAALSGDFNHDGRVDAADYVGGRKALGNSYFDQQFAIWRANFGKSLGSGQRSSTGFGSSAIPEPTAFALLAIGVIVRVLRSRQRD